MQDRWKKEPSEKSVKAMEVENGNARKAGVDENHVKKPVVAAPQPEMIPLSQIFMFAEPLDILLLILGAVSAAVVGTGMVFYNKFMGEAFDEISVIQLNPSGPDGVLKYFIYFLIQGLVMFIAGWTEIACFQISGERQATKMRRMYVEALLKKNMEWFDTEETTGSILFHLQNDATILQTTIADKVGNFISSLCSFVGCFVLALTTVWKLALVSLVIIPVIATTGGVYAYVLMGLTNKTQANYAKAGQIAEETLSQVRTVLSFVAENRSVQRYSAALSKSLSAGYKSGLVKGVGVGSLWGSVFLSYCLMLWFGGVCVRNGEASGGEVLTTLFAVVVGSLFLGQTLNSGAALSVARMAGVRIKNVLKEDASVNVLKLQGSNNNGKSLRKHRLKAVSGHIEIRSVYFAYPTRKDVQIFENFSLSIPAGKTLAVVGSSGSGKSTIIQLVERFYEPDRGTVFLDGIDTKTLDLKWLRSQIGLVSQEPALFATTIRENILYGKPDATMEEVVEATKAANAYKFITELKDGFDTEVGDKGSQLSGGQKQRIAISRAMIRNPPILLLDEATSALDTNSEQMVQEALDSLMIGRTTVMVAHRLTTITNADMIVVLQNGKIVEKGNHDRLLDLNGTYAKMVQMQDGPRQNSRLPSAAVSPAYTPGRRSPYSGAESPQVPWRRSTHMSTTYVDRSGAFSPLPNVALMMSPFRSPIGTPSRSINDIRAFESRDFGPRAVESRDFGPKSYVTMEFNSTSMVNDFSKAEMESFEESSDMEATHPRRKSPNGGFCRLLKLHKKEWTLGLAGVFGAFVGGLVMPALAVMLSTLLGVFYQQDLKKMEEEIANKIVFMGIMGLLTPLIYPIQHYFLGRMGENISQRMRERIFAVLLKNEVGFFDKDEHSSSQLAARISADSAMIKSTITDRLGVPASTVSLLAACYTYSFRMQPLVAAISIPIFPLIAIAGLVEKQVAGGVTGDLAKAQERSSQLAGEAVSNIRTVAAFNAEKKVVERFSAELEGPSKRSYRRGHVAGFALGFTQFLQYFSFGLILWYGGRLVAKGDATVQEVLSAFLTMIIACFATSEILALAPELLKGSPAMKSMFELLDRPTKIDADDRKGLKAGQIRGHIEFLQVKFAYPERPSVVIFRNLNLVVHPARSIALVGPSGSGKSSVIALIERFYDPISGCVRVDGEDIRRYNLKSLRKSIALVQQEPALFAMTIMENILYGNQSASEAEVIQAAQAANAHEFISGLPEGYRTDVGEKGAQLSGGQKQRIAIARAILKNPSILLLDEATSALDGASEKVVQAALDRLMRQRTTVIVAHRLSTVRTADSIAVLQDGEIVEQGRHSDLICDPLGHYSRLVQLQISSTI